MASLSVEEALPSIAHLSRTDAGRLVHILLTDVERLSALQRHSARSDLQAALTGEIAELLIQVVALCEHIGDLCTRLSASRA